MVRVAEVRFQQALDIALSRRVGDISAVMRHITGVRVIQQAGRFWRLHGSLAPKDGDGRLEHALTADDLLSENWAVEGPGVSRLKPRHAHDCGDCVLLAHADADVPGVPVVEYDLYFCARETTIVGRYGEDGNYMSRDLTLSSLWLRDAHPLLRFAREIAIERKLWSPT